MDKYVIALYIRLSVEDAKTESLSINHQRLELTKYADQLPEAENATILEFVDNGYSGTTFERPAVQQLLELVQSSEINCIIVKDFSRFGRNAIETGYFIEMVFPLFHTRFISIQDEFDTNSFVGDTGGMEVAFKYLISEYYSKDLSEKSKSAKYQKMQAGEYQSKICHYGYKKGCNNRLEIDEDAAAVVRIIFNLSLDGLNAQQIVQELYQRGIPTPGEYKARMGMNYHDISRCHNLWQRSTVLRILVDERYAGTYIIGKRVVKEVGSSRTRLKDESEWFKIPNHHPAIVDKELFDRVQAGLIRFKSKKKNFKKYNLRCKVFCGCCGHALYRRKKDPEFYCHFTRIATDFECHGMSINESELETMLYGVMFKYAEAILNIDGVDGFTELANKLSKQTGLEKQIENCDDHKRQLYEMLLLGEIDLESYRARKAVYDAKLKDLTRLHSILSAATRRMQMDSEEKAKLRKTAQDILSENGLTRTLTDKLIDRVYIYPDNRVEIV